MNLEDLPWEVDLRMPKNELWIVRWGSFEVLHVPSPEIRMRELKRSTLPVILVDLTPRSLL